MRSNRRRLLWLALLLAAAGLIGPLLTSSGRLLLLRELGLRGPPGLARWAARRAVTYGEVALPTLYRLRARPEAAEHIPPRLLFERAWLRSTIALLDAPDIPKPELLRSITESLPRDHRAWTAEERAQVQALRSELRSQRWGPLSDAERALILPWSLELAWSEAPLSWPWELTERRPEASGELAARLDDALDAQVRRQLEAVAEGTRDWGSLARWLEEGRGLGELALRGGRHRALADGWFLWGAEGRRGLLEVAEESGRWHLPSPGLPFDAVFGVRMGRGHRQPRAEVEEYLREVIAGSGMRRRLQSLRSLAELEGPPGMLLGWAAEELGELSGRREEELWEGMLEVLRRAPEAWFVVDGEELGEQLFGLVEEGLGSSSAEVREAALILALCSGRRASPFALWRVREDRGGRERLLMALVTGQEALGFGERRWEAPWAPRVLVKLKKALPPAALAVGAERCLELGGDEAALCEGLLMLAERAAPRWRGRTLGREDGWEGPELGRNPFAAALLASGEAGREALRERCEARDLSLSAGQREALGLD